MTVQDRVYTADDLWEICNLPENTDKVFELIEGSLIEISPSSAIPSVIAAAILRFISIFVSEHDLGFVAGADGGFRLSPKTVLSPDVAFVAKGRLTELPERFFPFAPDLAVEVVSPTDSIKATQRKAARYLAHGTHLVWIVYAKEKTVDICRPSQQGDMSVEEVGIEGELDDGDVLPGFKLPVRDIFRVIEK
jgi:Uma2 family endonuclease